MMLYSKSGKHILGTLEILTGRADIESVTLAPDGSFEVEYEGHTEVFWDSQMTVCRDAEGNDDNDRGERVFLDEQGDEYRESDLILVDDDLCDCEKRSWYGEVHDSACPVTLLFAEYGVDVQRPT